MIECINCLLDIQEDEYAEHLKECSYNDYLDLQLITVGSFIEEPIEDEDIWIWWQQL